MAENEARRLQRIRPNLERRALIYDLTRAFFKSRGFLEVETPLRMPAVAPELHIAPVESEGWYLSTSPELHMKRLLAAGYERLFQFSRCFRKGERGRHHNPEFTMLEWYRAGAGYMQVVSDTEQLVFSLAQKLGLGSVITYRGQRIDLTPPWPAVTVRDAFLRAAGWDPVVDPDAPRFDIDLVDKVIPGFPGDRPIVLKDYPAPMASLARLKPGQPQVAERAEVFMGGLELANAYSELTDAQEQASRFRAEAEQIQREQGRNAPLPQRFLEAVGHMPECAGIALGVDRLVMLLCYASSIDDVMAFTAETV